MIDHIFPILPIKDLINKDGKPTTSFKLVTGIKPLVSNSSMLFFPRVVRKATVHVETKALNMRNQHITKKGILCMYQVQER